EAGQGGGPLNGDGVDALAEHVGALHHQFTEDARGEEPAAVVDDDRRLIDLTGIIDGPGDGLVAGLFAGNDFDQRHLFHRAEEVDANKVVGTTDALGQAGDG